MMFLVDEAVRVLRHRLQEVCRAHGIVTRRHFVHGRTVDAQPDVCRLARTIGDPTRIRILMLLMEGRALTAKELAYGAGVEPATGTVHLQKLSADALVVSTTQGRHKYFRLASPDVARGVEGLLAIALPAHPKSPDKLPAIHRARFCYDHLAGRIGIEVTQALLQQKLLRFAGREAVLSAKGARWFNRFGVDVAVLSQTRRKFGYACLDWSERQDHLGGALGAALAQRMMDLGWIKKQQGCRTVTVTDAGRKGLKSHLGVTWTSNQQ